eukprot:6185855-Pyramimonas_sp.AAC.1
MPMCSAGVPQHRVVDELGGPCVSKHAITHQPHCQARISGRRRAEDASIDADRKTRARPEGRVEARLLAQQRCVRHDRSMQQRSALEPRLHAPPGCPWNQHVRLDHN